MDGRIVDGLCFQKRLISKSSLISDHIREVISIMMILDLSIYPQYGLYQFI